MKRILSIDGGGIRGIIPAVLCEYIETKSKAPIAKLFDLIAGTSTGAILALGFARPKCALRASELLELYEKDGTKIFANPRGPLRYLRRPKFANEGLLEVLRTRLGDATIGEAQVDVLVPAYDIKYRTPVTFTRRAAIESSDQNYLMRDIAAGTTAAPTYFQPHALGDRVLIDGGLVANNPSCLALIEAQFLWPNEQLLLVSLGTGTLAQTIDGDAAKDYGKVGWAHRVIDCIFDGTAKATEDYLAQTLPRERYWRFQCSLSEQTVDLDNVSRKAVIGLRQAANGIIHNHAGQLDRLIELLLDSAPESKEAKEARGLLAQTHQGLSQSLEIKNRIFTLGVQNKLNELLAETRDWANGTIRVPSDDRGRFLVDLYGEAKKSVFSTRLKHFSGIFQRSPLTRDILEAHKRADVPTTRVFIFDNADDISGFDYQEMVREHQAEIDVRVLVRDQASPTVEDFTIIDESAIGITEFVGRRGAAGKWTFEDREQIFVYQKMRAQLVAQSVPFADYRKRRNARFSLWTTHSLREVCAENIDSYQKISRKYFASEAADDEKVLKIQQKVGGIYLLERDSDTASRPVGIFSLIPVSRLGYRELEADSLKGSEFQSEHLASEQDGLVLAYYLGAIAGVDTRASAALTDFLLTSARELGRQGAESFFARPVTDDGLRLLKGREMHWKGPSGGNPEAHRMCRLRLN